MRPEPSKPNRDLASAASRGSSLIADRIPAPWQLALQDSHSVQALHRLARLTSRVLAVPVALAWIVEAGRLRLRGRAGAAPSLVSRRDLVFVRSLCQFVATSNAPLIIEDARARPFVDDGPTVAPSGVGSFVGIPLTTPDGQVLGCCCVIDNMPRAWAEDEVATLTDFAATILTEIEVRALARETARQADEAERWRAGARFRGLLEAAPEAMVTTDHHGRIVLVNSQTEKLFGYPREELLGQTIEILLPERLQDLHVRQRTSYQTNPHSRPMGIGLDLWGRRKDGSEFPAEISLSPLKTEDEILVISAVRDITERKRAEEARADLVREQVARAEAEAAAERARRVNQQLVATTLRARQLADEAQTALAERQRAEESLRFLVEATSVLAFSLDYETTLQSIAHLAVPHLADLCVISLVDSDGSVRRVAVNHTNPARADLAERLPAVVASDHDGPPSIARIPGSGHSEIVPEVLPSAAATTSLDPAQLQIIADLGCKSLMVVPMLAQGWTLGAISFAVTESDRGYGPADLALAESLAHRAALAITNARLYREAQEALRARDEFLSIAAHELKTPVTSLRAFAQFAVRQLGQQGSLDPRRLQSTLQTIDRQSDKLARLVSQLLDVSRLESGRLALDRSPADICALVDGVVAIEQANAGEHRIVFQAPAPVTALVDSLRLEQVVTNLIDNAIKFSPDGSQIDVDVSAPGVPGEEPFVQISVRDRGIGIPPAHRARIFDRFYQAHGKGQLKGMGLGLYISRHIVDLHGGRIEAEFPADGGTRFVVTLPRNRVEPSSGTTEEPK